ncbi:WRKY DNA-binding transcription factor 70 [Ziziphus jujuba]|uniref:WRKY DNA-binding transcription factor 70 n=1 Tax=Ziziphus jujuba TaxID=326968 RepID=A0A6P4AMA3_ZIZJJ|nr:WRKY DNA-binding transcription factor 70 [Ziziphus jujuba]
MEGFWPENLVSTNFIQKKVNDELVAGQELAKQLRNVLAKSDDDPRSAEDLMMQIVKSFSNTLSILNFEEGHDVASVISQIQTDLPCLDARKMKDHSRESFRRSTTTPTKKDRRAFYDRRRTSSLRTWNIDTPTLINDGQTWRKYGQKVILNAKYPRHYFRCTYKYDQGCKATKQIQRIQVNPPLYRTTYFGNHTCRNLHQDPELILDCTSPSDTSIFISFDSTNLINKQDHVPFLSSLSSIKQEIKEDIITCDANHSFQTFSSSDNFMFPDLAAFPSPAEAMAVLSSTLDQSDYGDAMYGMTEYDNFLS